VTLLLPFVIVNCYVVPLLFLFFCILRYTAVVIVTDDDTLLFVENLIA
jgi:hypothetical protein